VPDCRFDAFDNRKSTAYNSVYDKDKINSTCVSCRDARSDIFPNEKIEKWKISGKENNGCWKISNFKFTAKITHVTNHTSHIY
jgi:hypothetical protein